MRPLPATIILSRTRLCFAVRVENTQLLRPTQAILGPLQAASINLQRLRKSRLSLTRWAPCFKIIPFRLPPPLPDRKSAAKVQKQCIDDVNALPAVSYGRALGGATPDFAIIGDVTTGINAVATLYNAVVAMLTPIIVTPAKEYDAQQRAAAIANFFINYRTTLLNAAQSLANSGSALAKQGRLEALGQYAETMASLRSATIDLSSAQCQRAIASPLLDTIQNLGQSYYIPNDDFVICYAGAWKQVADQVKAVLTAADQYDKFADASDDDLQNAVKQIRDNIDHINDVGASAELNAVLEGAGKLIAYGQTVSQALSKDNLDKAQASINDLMKLIGSK
jgi:hypothetical protein